MYFAHDAIDDATLSVRFTLKSGNAKVGPMPVTMSSSSTCPDACPLKDKGCYAKYGPIAMHWRTTAAQGSDWSTFLGKVKALPEGTIWRHNQAGDLPGINDKLDTVKLRALVKANKGRRGFTYTHKPMDNASARNAIAHANANGFTVNLSADTLAEADTLADLNIAPIVVVLDAAHGERHDMVTPAGRKVATCPATYRDDVTCATCQLCQRRDRKVIVGFPAHGMGMKAARAIAGR